MKPCRLDIKNRILKRVHDELIAERYTYGAIEGTNNRFYIKNSQKVRNNKANDKRTVALNIAKSKMEEINRKFKDNVRARYFEKDRYNPVMVEVFVNPAYVEHEFNKLTEKNPVPIDFSRDLQFFNGDRALMEQELSEDSEFMHQTEHDKNRMKVNHKLNKFMKSILAKIGVTVENLEDFKVRYKQKTGLEITDIGIADLLNNIIAVSKDSQDGTTLSEEAFHFLTDMFWDQPIFKNIRDLKSNGVDEDFKLTETYKTNFTHYHKLYKGDQEKLDKEIIGKLMAQAIYDQVRSESLSQKILSQLEKVLNYVLGKIFRQIRLTHNVSKTDITDQLNSLLTRSVAEVRSDSFQSSLTSRGLGLGTEITVNNIDFSENLSRALINKLEARKQELAEKKIGLYNEELKQRKIDLTNALAIANLNQLATEISALKNSTTALTPSEQARLADLTELYALIKADALDEKNIKKIEDINDRIKSIDAQISKEKFEAGIFMFFFGPNGDGVGGIIQDLNSYQDAIQKIKNNQLEFGLAEYYGFTEALSLYAPIVETLNRMFTNNHTFKELSPEANKKLNKVIQASKIKLGTIQDFMNNEASNQVKNLFKEYVGINPELERRISQDTIKLYNIGILNFKWGAAQNAKEDLLGIYNKKLMDVLNVIHSKTNSSSIDILQKIAGKKYDAREFQEVDENGKPTHYWLNPFNITKWNKAREEGSINIIKKVEDISRKAGFNVKIPSEQKKIDELFGYNNPTTPLGKHIKELEKTYNKLWSDWYSKNTMAHPDAANIIAKRQASMSKTQFKHWLAKNVHVKDIIEDDVTYTVTYYTGELSVPSDGSDNVNPITGAVVTTNDYRSSQYNNLKSSNPEALSVLETLKEAHQKAQERLPLNYSYELVNRLPQISRSYMDILYQKNKGAGLYDKFTDTFSIKEDDLMYADRIEVATKSEIIDRPRIRFLSKLEEADNISMDLVKSISMFTEMSNHYGEFMEVLPELNGIIEAAKHTEREDSHIPKGGLYKIFDIFKSKDEVEDYLLHKLEHMKKTIIQGEMFNKGGHLSAFHKFASTLKKYTINQRLLGNVPSMITGYISGQIENTIESILGKYNTKESNLFAKREFFIKHSADVLKDLTSPIKQSKISIIAQDIGLVDSIERNFQDTNRNKILRFNKNMIDWGGWRLADVALKYEALIATAHNIRFIDGNFYTKQSWDMFVKQNPTRNISEFDTAPTMYDGIDGINGKVAYKSYVTPEAIAFYKNRVKIIASRLDSVPLDVDKGQAYNDVLLQFSTINTGWLFQMLERGFKSKQFNYGTQEKEIGYWKAFLDPFDGNVIQLLNPMKWVELRDKLTDAEPEVKEGFYRISLMAAATSMTFMLAYVLNAMILGDDDDEDPWTKYLVYLSTRALMEQESRVSASDVLRYINEPISGAEELKNFANIFTLPFVIASEAMFGSTEVKSGMYAGYSKTQKDFIKSIPLVRGWFENLYGGYVNEALGKEKTSIATSISGKNTYIKNQLINDTEWYSVANFPLGFISKMVGKLAALPIAKSTTDYPESKSMIALPDKKSNKEEN